MEHENDANKYISHYPIKHYHHASLKGKKNIILVHMLKTEGNFE